MNCLRLLTAIVAIGFSSAAWAAQIVSIEEHWELQVGAPDAASTAPQVSMVMGPYSDLENDYFVFTLNHRNSAQFEAGGMQVQRWCGGELEKSRSGADTGPLMHNDETVTWVQRLKVADGTLTFEVVSGESTSWGSFGSEGELKLSQATSLSDLDDYRPQISIGQSGVSFAGNRVRSLILKKLRWVDAAGQEYELVAPIDVDTDLDP